MIRSLDTLQGYGLRATDGSVGKIADLYFDDHAWIVRYVVVDTGGWLTGRAVLISPSSLEAPDDDGLEYPVTLRGDA
jgi:predicted secreted protein